MGKKTLNQMLAERKLPERTVKTCLRADVAADIEHLEDEIGRASCRERVYLCV